MSSTEPMPNPANWDRVPSPWKDFNPCSPKSLNNILKGLEAAPRKRWGQNFLIDSGAQQNIVRAAGVQPQDHVWEIGPGLGALTQHLWRNCRNLTLFEIDPVLLHFYQSRLPDRPDEPAGETGPCQLVAGDVVKTWCPTGFRNDPDWCPDVIISNLPYNTASMIMTMFAREAQFRPRCMVFTVQKEMAERLTAKERSKPYSSFSVLLQSRFHIECLFDIPARLFYPEPNVVSSTIRLRPRPHGLNPVQIEELERFTRAIFSQRRKTIANNIKSCHYKEQFVELEAKLAGIGIRCSQRAEEITIEQFLALGSQL
ncbi:16S rRNA (adenine(1518)-N(6)/adenine(1519)-N(6))-dimethyltransferase RsmA [Candidatus Haliotispira prima]|uniref:Ribosomal RNA small subunit methyltransferase A n=1 Tax=Candidatus Haliotispira prima TaxID=3034016 RepID=A0ABY8MKQ1_9SPIO|nr:16S rRNA (adenine(1518)-N(6)/adenine(1519)-N(6))-dimethyltransferase RsmA [Candidatus Haliotispira prima]